MVLVLLLSLVVTLATGELAASSFSTREGAVTATEEEGGAGDGVETAETVLAFTTTGEVEAVAVGMETVG
jgi:hypothetical protein